MKKFLLTALLLLPAPVLAVDGVVLINQATITAAGGFPYTLAQPGSYKLSGNLAVPANTNGIVIAVNNVTLDLAGFSITTTPPVVVPPFTTGIRSNGGTVSSAVTIKSGTIRGFTNPIEPGGDTTFWRLEDLVLDSAIPAGGTVSMDLGSYTRVWHVTAFQVNVNVLCPSVVTETMANAIGIPPGTPGNCAFVSNATVH